MRNPFVIQWNLPYNIIPKSKLQNPLDFVIDQSNLIFSMSMLTFESMKPFCNITNHNCIHCCSSNNLNTLLTYNVI